MTGLFGNSLSWVGLRLPAPLHPKAVQAALDGLAGLSGQPRVVLEAIGNGRAVSWRLGAERDVLGRVVRALRAHLPGLGLNEETADGTLPIAAARLAAPGGRRAPLNTDRAEDVSRGILAALSAAVGPEQVKLQVILGVRYPPSRLPSQQWERDERHRLAVKLAEHRFGCAIRFAAGASSAERAWSLVTGVVSALRPLQAPGVSLTIRRVGPRRVDAASSPFLWPLELGVSELMGLLGWPISSNPEAELPGVPPQHPKLLAAAPSVARKGRPLGVSSVDSQRPLALREGDALRHLHILGPNGVGKSTLMARLALHDISGGHGVVVIDPKGDLVDDLLARIPDERAGDVIVLDPREPSPVGVDCFSGDPDLASDVMLSVFHSLYADSWGPRTNDILHACLLSLARRAASETADASTGGVSLLMIPVLLTNPGFRRSVIGRVVKADPLGLGSFWATFEAWSEGERAQAIAPLMNKLRQVLLRPGLRSVFGQRRPRLALSDVFTKRRILLVSLAEGTLGPEAAELLGALTVGLMWNAALASRMHLPEQARRPVFIHIDEVQRYLRLPGDLGDALARARGLGVAFTLAHQHLGQLPATLRDAVLANARSKVAFQLPAADARVYAGMTGGQLEAVDFETLPAFHAYTGLLNHNAPTPWCSLTTEPLSLLTVPERSARIRHLRNQSAAAYGRPLSELERDLVALVQPGGDSHEQSGDGLGRRRLGRPSTTGPGEGAAP